MAPLRVWARVDHAVVGRVELYDRDDGRYDDLTGPYVLQPEAPLVRFTAHEVNEVRRRTTAGMVDAKAVLVETGGNVDDACAAILRRGLAVSRRNAGRPDPDSAPAASPPEQPTQAAPPTLEVRAAALARSFVHVEKRVAGALPGDETVFVGPKDDQDSQLHWDSGARLYVDERKALLTVTTIALRALTEGHRLGVEETQRREDVIYRDGYKAGVADADSRINDLCDAARAHGAVTALEVDRDEWKRRAEAAETEIRRRDATEDRDAQIFRDLSADLVRLREEREHYRATALGLDESAIREEIWRSAVLASAICLDSAIEGRSSTLETRPEVARDRILLTMAKRKILRLLRRGAALAAAAKGAE